MNQLYDFLVSISQYRDLIRFGAVIFGAAIILILIGTAFRNLFLILNEQKEEMERESNLKNLDYDTLGVKKKAAILRKIVAPDGVDPGPNGYLVISDGGREYYLRTLTIAALPRRDKFASTFAGLLDFPNCTSSVFVKPISEEQIVTKMDRHITVLASEYATAEGDVNRQRKLNAQYQDASRFAEQVENGENRFFSVGFVFTLRAESIVALNKMTQDFHALAMSKNIVVSNCFAVQAEAFLKNEPFNDMLSTGSTYIKSDAIKYFQMDKRSISAVFNYTQSTYSHKEGIALGRDMHTESPVIFDIYDPSHDGFTLVIAGKTGCGKSATIKMMASREVIHGFHYVCVDSQSRKGLNEGEYASLALLCNGVNFQISSSSEEVMNIFEVSETTKTTKDKENAVYEVRTLELSDKITMVSHVLSTMIRNADSEKGSNISIDTYINRIIIDNITQMYKSFGIIEGDPDSLYTTPNDRLASRNELSPGRVVKILPTLTDFYKQVLISRMGNNDPSLAEAYNIIVMSLEDYVRELYYSEDTCVFFTRDQFNRLPRYEGSGGNIKQYTNDKHKNEKVREIHGIKPYFDGQSSVHINKDLAFTNIDISQLPDSEKALARQVAIDFVNENFIKKNSENIKSADRLVCIFDECHEMFNNKYCRETLDNVVRTARKRNVALILSSQTIKEYDNYKETQAILKQAAVKMVFKQDMADKDYLVKTLGLTDAQAGHIVTTLGGDPDQEGDRNQHRGEVCIIDNKTVCFCKVDYRRSTEALAVETDARGIEDLFNLQRAG